MKKSNRVILIIILVAMFVISNISFVMASSATVSLSGPSGAINKGNTFQVEVKISNIDIGNGATAVVGTLEYDTEVLELVEGNQETQIINSWTKSYNPETKSLLIDRAANSTDNQTIAILPFKVKETATKTSATITYKNIKVSDENEEVTVSDATANVTIQTNSNNNNNNNNSSNSNNNSSNSNSGNNNSSSSSKKSSGTSSKSSSKKSSTSTSSKSSSSTSSSKAKTSTSNSGKSIPKLGVEDNFIAIGLLLVVIGGGTLCYIKYKDYKGI